MMMMMMLNCIGAVQAGYMLLSGYAIRQEHSEMNAKMLSSSDTIHVMYLVI